jgi:hypothetical protein
MAVVTGSEVHYLIDGTETFLHSDSEGRVT